jgi:hypothetical protein
VVYILAAQGAMIAAMIFLLRTPVHLIYDQLTFYIGLWGLAIGAAAPELRQLEGNYAVTAVLVPLCVMIGYALFTLNRRLQQDRPAAARARVAEPFQPLSRLGQGLAWAMIPVLGLALWTTLTQLTHTDALSRIAGASTLIPAGVMTLEQSVLSARALAQGQDAWAAEWSRFIIAALVASPSLHWMLPVIGQMPIETQYIETGHAFRLAAYGQWMLLIGAFLCAIHSQATHAKLAR